MKKILAGLLLLVICLVGGCSIDLGHESIILPTELYVSANGYELMVPTAWTKEENSQEQITLHSEDNQLAVSITTELGGIDYYSMRELKEQFTEELGEHLFKDYSVIDDNNGTKYFHTVMKGTDTNGAKIYTEVYAYQPYLTMRHYIVVVSANGYYDQYRDVIEKMVDSFTNTKTEEEYLQLMKDRREAAAKAELEADKAADENTDGDDSEDDNSPDTSAE